MLSFQVRKNTILFLFLFLSQYAVIAQISLIKDVDNTIKDAVTSGISSRELTNYKDMLVFVGRSAESGFELWKSDGVTTSLIKDIAPGMISSDPYSLTVVGDQLFFIATDAIHGKSLFKTDGTTDGTELLIDFPLMVDAKQSTCIMVPASNLLYAAIRKSPWIWDLWRSDGTKDGTFKLLENFADGEISNLHFGTIDNQLIFLGYSPTYGFELWSSDGTPAGTTLLKDIEIGAGPSYPRSFIKVGDNLFFRASTSDLGNELWKTDGSNAGTHLVKDINPGPGSSRSITEAMIDFNGLLLFNATDGTNNGLWSSDGTSDGTVFKQETGIPTKSGFYAIIGNKIYFRKSNGANYELWVWDGQANTSELVKAGYWPLNLIGLNGTLYFVANDALGQQVWRSDGTSGGTYPITEFLYNTSEGKIGPSYLTIVNSVIFFTASANEDSGNELWKIDQENNLIQVTDLPLATYGSWIWDMVAMNGEVYFPGGTKEHGLEPWKTDGSEAGTVLLKDIIPGDQYASSLPNFYEVIQDIVFFKTNNQKLWRSDGTTSGTVEITNGISPSGADSYLYIDNTLYVPVTSSTYGNEIIKSAYPFHSSEVLKDINPGSANSFPTNLILHKNTIYFTAEINGAYSLWKSEGTSESTVKIKDLFDYVYQLTSSGEFIYFFNNDGIHGNELWRSDGTNEGTVMVRDIVPGSAGLPYRYSIVPGQVGMPPAYPLLDINGTLYFVTNDGQHGEELWKSDGTEAGTRIVKDIFEGPTSSIPIELTLLDGTLLFSADDGIYGRELWMTDGTEEGTHLLADLNPGAYSSSPATFRQYKNVLYFTAYNNTVRTLWKTYGKDCGTIMVTDNSDVSLGEQMVIVDDKIFMEGWRADTGTELFLHNIENDIPISQECKEIITSIVPEEETIMAIYPNPVVGVLQLKMLIPLNRLVKIQIINSIGQTFYSQDVDFSSHSEYSLDLKLYPTGQYLLIVRDQTGTLITSKIIKQ